MRPSIVGEECIVEGGERMERDAGLRQEREELVVGVIKERGGEEAAGGGDEGRGGALRGLGGDKAAAEGRRGRQLEDGVGVGVDVEVELVGVAAEELLPERGEDEVRVGEKEESDLGRRAAAEKVGGGGGGRGSGRRGGEDGSAEEGEVIGLVGVRDGRERLGREQARREEEDDRDGEEQEQGEQERRGVRRRHLRPATAAAPAASPGIRIRRMRAGRGQCSGGSWVRGLVVVEGGSRDQIFLHGREKSRGGLKLGRLRAID